MKKGKLPKERKREGKKESKKEKRVKLGDSDQSDTTTEYG